MMNIEVKTKKQEFKYYIDLSDYIKHRVKLKIFLMEDKNCLNDGSYHVRSLYFDDIDDSVLNSNIHGENNKKKYRIRIYNKNDKTIKLERKSGNSKDIIKEYSMLTRSEYEKILKNDIGFLANSEDEIKRDFFVEMIKNLIRPKTVVDFEREAYEDIDKGIRITFDKHLMFARNAYDIFDKNLITVSAFYRPTVIMEIKYANNINSHIQSLLPFQGKDNIDISKYTTCRMAKTSMHNMI